MTDAIASPDFSNWSWCPVSTWSLSPCATANRTQTESAGGSKGALSYCVGIESASAMFVWK